MTAALVSHLAPGRHLSPARVGEDLRHEASAEIRRRRGVTALSLVGAGAMAALALYQTGIVRRLPGATLRVLSAGGDAAEAAESSADAYARASAPDGLLGLTSYAVTATLAAAGGAGRSSRRPWVSLAMGAKILFDLIAAARLTRRRWSRHGAVSGWRILGALATLAMVPLAAPEVRDAARNVLPAGE